MPAARLPILFITSSRIGDAVLSSGLIKHMIDEAPHATFTIAGGPLVMPLFRDMPGMEKLIPFEKKGMAHWLDLWSQTRKRRWSLVCDMRGSAIASFLRTGRRAVKKPPNAALGPLHKVVEAARVLRIEDDPPAPYLFTSAATEARAADLTQGSGPILALAPAANWVGKTWPAERFAVLAAELLGPAGPMAGGRLMIVGGPGDRMAGEVVRRSMARDRLIDLVGSVDLLTTYACLKRARLFVGNDSGLMHLAAAAGAPTLGLFGPSDDRLYAPWGPKARALRGPREFETFLKVDPGLDLEVCHMLDLPIEWVARAAHQLYRDTLPPPTAVPDFAETP